MEVLIQLIKKGDRSSHAIINLFRRYCDKRIHFKVLQYKKKINTCPCIFQDAVLHLSLMLLNLEVK